MLTKDSLRNLRWASWATWSSLYWQLSRMQSIPMVYYHRGNKACGLKDIESSGIQQEKKQTRALGSRVWWQRQQMQSCEGQISGLSLVKYQNQSREVHVSQISMYCKNIEHLRLLIAKQENRRGRWGTVTTHLLDQERQLCLIIPAPNLTRYKIILKT